MKGQDGTGAVQLGASIGAIEPSLRLAEAERVKRKRPDSLDAYVSGHRAVIPKCPQLAQMRSAATSDVSLLSGVERT